MLEVDALSEVTFAEFSSMFGARGKASSVENYLKLGLNSFMKFSVIFFVATEVKQKNF